MYRYRADISVVVIAHFTTGLQKCKFNKKIRCIGLHLPTGFKFAILAHYFELCHVQIYYDFTQFLTVSYVIPVYCLLTIKMLVVLIHFNVSLKYIYNSKSI